MNNKKKNLKNAKVVRNKDDVKKNKIEQSNMEKKNLFYLSYTKRLTIISILFVLLFAASIFFALSSFSLINAHTVNYQEKSDIDYKVYLNKNDFYENDYLGKDMSYIASLINKINTTFSYQFKIEEESDVEFSYDIIATLNILDSTGKNTFYRKEYTLLERKTVEMNSDKNYVINENIDIDYPYYNDLVNQFKNNFLVSTMSNLVVTFKVNEKSLNGDLKINNTETMSLNIPLSQREITISLLNNGINNYESTIKNTSVQISNVTTLVLSIVLFMLAIFFGSKIVKMLFLLNPEKTKYDIYVSKILREYDRLIVNTETGPIISEDNIIIKVDSFQELLDVRDNLKVPIKFYNIVNHQKCLFYISKDNEIYEYVVKAVDMEDKMS